MMRFNNFFVIVALLVTDLVAYYISLVIAWSARTAVDNIFQSVGVLTFDLVYLMSIWWIPVIFVLFFAYFGLYSKRRPVWEEMANTFKAVAFAAIFIFAIISLGRLTDTVSRLFLVILFIALPLVSILFKWLVKNLLFNYDRFKKNVMLIAPSDKLDMLSKTFVSEKYLGYHIVKRFDIAEILSDVNWVDNLSSAIDSFVKKYKIDVLIFAPDKINSNDFMDIAGKAHPYVDETIIVPSIETASIAAFESSHMLEEQLAFFTVKNNLKSAVNTFIKRVMDIVIGILLLPILLPVIAALAIVVKATSKGPAFFTHTRIGKYGKPFKLIKLRTMYKDADKRLKEILATDPVRRKEWEADYKFKEDPRVTPIGAFLRRTSLDELPQFLNVFQGSMSFVGPRPVLQEELDKYYKEYSRFYCMVKPGITGLWQITGRNDTTYDERVRRDSWYVINWSVWLDLVILIKTPLVVIFKKGAY